LTSKEMEDRSRSLLNRAKKLRRGFIIEGDDLIFVRDILFPNHPRLVEKTGPGIAGFEVRWNPDHAFPNYALYAIRIDGTAAEFSYKKCSRPNNIPQHAARAFREAVDEQIRAFKAQHPMIDWKIYHVDHYGAGPRSFLMLVRAFFEETGESVEEWPKLGSAFANYHYKYAALRPILAEEHLRRRKKEMP